MANAKNLAPIIVFFLLFINFATADNVVATILKVTKHRSNITATHVKKSFIAI